MKRVFSAINGKVSKTLEIFQRYKDKAEFSERFRPFLDSSVQVRVLPVSSGKIGSLRVKKFAYAEPES